MGRDNDLMDYDSDRRRIESAPVVLRQLFDKDTHDRIIEFLDVQAPMMPLFRQEPDFMRTCGLNLPFFVRIHYKLLDLARQVFDEPVKPSYCFLSSYDDGGSCPLHIDRSMCRYTIDYLIRQENPEPWPLLISDVMTDSDRNECDDLHLCRPTADHDIETRLLAETWHLVELQPNDATCYSGTHSWHYRPTQAKGTADLVFFHFVPEAYDGPLH